MTLEENASSKTIKNEITSKNNNSKKNSTFKKNEPTNPEVNNPYYTSLKAREKLENHYIQETPGKYVITTMDKKLIKSYTRRYILKFQHLKPAKAISWNEKERGPYGRWNHVYEPLKIDRSGISTSGKKWKINIDEEFSGEFIINGVNSLDQQFDKKCKTLLECLNML